jgi:histidine phosphotransferase ChpT
MFNVTAQGERAKLPQQMVDVLTGAVAADTLDARMVQPYYAKLLAQTAGLSLAMAMTGDDVVAVTAV